MKHTTRESWLQAAVAEMAKEVETAAGSKLPKGLQVLVSWPYRSKTAGGQYFPPSFAKDKKTTYLIVSPSLEEDRVLDVLMHEMVHAVLPDVDGHGGLFKKTGQALGLEGNMRSSRPGKELQVRLTALAKHLGPYPHQQMVEKHSPKKSNAKTIVRLVSPADPSYSCWLSPKQFAEHGAPVCPISGKPMVAP